MRSVYLLFSGTEFHDLYEYLISHEQEICLGVDDFGQLSRVFEEVVGRPIKLQEEL